MTNNEFSALVTAVHKERYQLEFQGAVIYGRVKQGAYHHSSQSWPTVGDTVLIVPNDLGDCQIIETLPRKSYFARKDPRPGGGEQAVAANFDYVFILTSLNQDYSPHRIERYLTLAWDSGAQPVVVLTKADLCPDCAAKVRETEAVAPGVPVHAVSSQSGFGLETLCHYFENGKTSVFLGSSGVGKSSLVNALAGSEIMSTGEIRESDGRGRHTTTHRQLLRLPTGGVIIDTPGMRELGMWGGSQGLEEAFADVKAILAQPCRFSDCRHETEPGCVVLAALKDGRLDPQRWKSYISLQREVRYSEDYAAAMADKRERFKAIAKANKGNRKR